MIDRLSGGQVTTVCFVLYLGVECMEHRYDGMCLGEIIDKVLEFQKELLDMLINTQQC